MYSVDPSEPADSENSRSCRKQRGKSKQIRISKTADVLGGKMESRFKHGSISGVAFMTFKGVFDWDQFRFW